MSMTRRAAALLLSLSLCSGCMSTHTDEVRVRGPETRRVLAPDSRDSSLTSEFTFSAGVATGTLRWAATCREALVQSESIDLWQTRSPMYGAAVGALAAGAALGAGSGVLLANAPNYSTQERCSTDDYGHESCSSPREAAIVLGATGAVISVIAVAAGISTFASKTERTRGESLPQPDHVVEITRHNVSCGREPLAGVGVSVFRGDERVSASITNSVGEVAFAIPPNVSGELGVVVDSVPPRLARVREGDVIGTIAVPVTTPEG